MSLMVTNARYIFKSPSTLTDDIFLCFVSGSSSARTALTLWSYGVCCGWLRGHSPSLPALWKSTFVSTFLHENLSGSLSSVTLILLPCPHGPCWVTNNTVYYIACIKAQSISWRLPSTHVYQPTLVIDFVSTCCIVMSDKLVKLAYKNGPIPKILSIQQQKYACVPEYNH